MRKVLTTEPLTIGDRVAVSSPRLAETEAARAAAEAVKVEYEPYDPILSVRPRSQKMRPVRPHLSANVVSGAARCRRATSL